MSTGVYAKTAGDLIRDALRAATISGISLPVQSEDFVQGESALNDILMSLQTEQIHVWAQTEALIPLNPDQTKYVFGTDHIFTNYVYTTADAAIATVRTENFMDFLSSVTVGRSIRHAGSKHPL